MAQPVVDPDSLNQSLASSPIQQLNPHANDSRYPSVEVINAALRRENEILRARVVDAEREFVRTSRLNDIYREEIIELRRRVSHLLSKE